MITPDEAVKTMDANIAAMPENKSEKYGFILSKEVAQALYDYVGLKNPKPFGQRKIAESEQEFFWKGIKCKIV